MENKFILGKYARLRLRYLQEQKRVDYSFLVVENQLKKYLADIDKIASERFDLLMKEYAKKENITEELKANNQMEWVGKMNNIKHCVEEIILKELIYV